MLKFIYLTYKNYLFLRQFVKLKTAKVNILCHNLNDSHAIVCIELTDRELQLSNSLNGDMTASKSEVTTSSH